MKEELTIYDTLQFVFACLSLSGKNKIGRYTLIDEVLAELKETSKWLPDRHKKTITIWRDGLGRPICAGLEEALNSMAEDMLIYHESPSFNPVVFESWKTPAHWIIKEQGVEEDDAVLFAQEFEAVYLKVLGKNG